MGEGVMMLVSSLLLAVVAIGHLASAQRGYEVVYRWKTLDFEYPSEEDREEALGNGSFIPENCTLTGLKVFQGDVFVTVSRWAKGVPSTLNLVDPNSTLLVPWPSWEMNTIGDCDKFQFVQSMEVDPVSENMWVIDTGAAADFDYGDSPCPAKLVVVNITTGEVVRSHSFPPEVVQPGNNFLNDIVLDFQDPMWEDDPGNVFAYITDVRVPGIVVYDFAADRSWRAYHNQSMEPEPEAGTVDIPGFPVDLPEPKPGTDGIALSPRSNTNNRRVFYCPLAGFPLYSVDTSILRDESTATDESAVGTVVRLEGVKPSQTDGMIISSDGYLYFGLLSQSSVVRWNTSLSCHDEANDTTCESESDFPDQLEPILSRQSAADSSSKVVAKDTEDMEWPDTFSIDEGYLYVTTNRLNRFFSGVLDTNDYNYRVLRTYIGVGSYLDP